MSTTTVRHAYNDVVATHYDLDPQGVIGRSLDLGIAQMKKQGLIGEGGEPLSVLDVGMGTGLFLGKLKEAAGDQVVPFGVDLAENMVEFARKRIPDLNVVVGDASDLRGLFPGHQFSCVCTHFVTGFVPMKVLAPQIAERLKPGGYWSLVGGTRKAYGALQAKGESWFLRKLAGAGDRKVDDTVLNPADLAEVEQVMNAHGLDLVQGETFRPALEFNDFDQFMEFGYRGGWLTPLIESLGLPQAGPLKRWLINRLIFPVTDAHDIVIALGRKRGG
ncbi:MAG: class I SAM-dependent methyltransferase [Isosphaeraceae bacterium]